MSYVSNSTAFLAQLKIAKAGILTDCALHVEAGAKVNITKNGQIDTGFMRASVQTSAPNEKTGSGELPDADENTAYAGATANYSLYQEARKAFMFPALSSLVGAIGGIIEKNKL